MTFKDAIEKMRGLGGTKYRTLNYEYMFDGDGTERHKCIIYDSDLSGTRNSIHEAETWEKAFSFYEAVLNRKNPLTASLEGAPQEDTDVPF